MPPRLPSLLKLLHLLPNSPRNHPPLRSSPSPPLLTTALTTLKLVFLLHFLTTHIASLNPTTGPSMLPTLSVNDDWILTSKYHRRGRGVRVGDVVDFAHPLVVGEGAVKRVVGMPGDFVVADGWGGGVRGGMIQVPEGHCWILGDNLPESRDSRVYGPLPLALIKGKSIARVWPLSDMKWLRNNLQRPEEEM